VLGKGFFRELVQRVLEQPPAASQTPA
jgi:hypothetical protein